MRATAARHARRLPVIHAVVAFVLLYYLLRSRGTVLLLAVLGAALIGG